MNTYQDYLKEIEERKENGLHPKPIDGDVLLLDIIKHINDKDSNYRKDCLQFFIYNVLEYGI